jgi:hypothetical protein
MQSAIRGHQARVLAHRHRAATLIQSFLRMCVARSRYLQLQEKIMRAQAACRAFLERKRFQELRAATIMLQVIS